MKLLTFMITLMISIPVEAAPKIFFKKADILDLQMARITGRGLGREAYQEFDTTIPKFQLAWDRYANLQILETSEKVAGKKFKRKEFTSWLTLAPLIPMGRPLIMNASPYLENTPKIGPKASMDAFVALNHHEVLHLLLEEFEGAWLFEPSKLAQKYKNENPNALVHLHLIAVQKATYLGMGKDGERLLEEADKTYRQVIKGDYLRAWEIVSKEGHEAFLRELSLSK